LKRQVRLLKNGESPREEFRSYVRKTELRCYPIWPLMGNPKGCGKTSRWKKKEDGYEREK
jgi:hypothetical protein